MREKQVRREDGSVNVVLEESKAGNYIITRIPNKYIVKAVILHTYTYIVTYTYT